MRLLFTLIFIVSFSSYASAALIGNDVTFQCPECGPPYSQTFTAIIGGPELTPFDQFAVDVEGNSLRIDYLVDLPDVIDPAHAIFSWDTGIYDISNAFLDVSSTLAYDFVFTQNSVSIDVGGIPVSTGDFVKINLEQVSNVPVPAAVWLFLSALIGLIGLKRKRQNSCTFCLTKQIT